MIPSRKDRVPCNGIEVYYEAFGDPGNPAVLLVMGMDEQCTLWFPYFYEPIVQAGHHVVRFDNRDCGLSQWIDDWDEKRPYTLEDMAADTVGLMDALGIEKAHLVGASMGGMICQRIAIDRPNRVHTLTSIASSGFPLDPDPDLQPDASSDVIHAISEDLIARYPSYRTAADETIEYRLGVLRLFTGSRFPFDEPLHRGTQTKNILDRRGFNPLAQAHQLAAVVASGSRLNELKRITAPTLIIHGTEDPLLPRGHAIKCASRIPGARLVWMDGVGHEIPAGVMGQVQQEMVGLWSSSLSPKKGDVVL
jgi:pimeloyl-ACP methyl ester carboxylesterase